jgi:hypothetical protein
MHEGVNWQAYFARFTRGKYFQQRAMTHPSTAVELAQLLLFHEARTHPDMLIRPQVLVPPELPPWRQVADRVEAICATAGHAAADDRTGGPGCQDREGSLAHADGSVRKRVWGSRALHRLSAGWLKTAL